MLDPELLEWITARRAEPDELEEQLAKQLVEARAERDELAVAERVLDRVSVQLADERASAAPSPGHVGGRAVMLIPHRMPEVEETMLPPDYQRILAAVRQATGPVMARQVGEILGVDVTVRAKLEPLRGGWSDSLIVAGCANRRTAASPHANVSAATVRRWRDELIALLAAQAPRLDRALKKVAKRGGEVVLIDGPVIPTQRRTGKADRPNYSGKHHHHRLHFLPLTDEKGRLIWISAARPGHTHNVTAARHDHVLAHLRAAGLGALADSASATWTATYATP
ncbi:transposase family protein [Streptomyces malaysiensis subsp. malaysiensis]|uniref:transposase family protein n=1 Tax=Streptomyces malaysiensis TaxID=92644 RepID=UPI0024BFBD4E|nr:transposase family protein [Streptomyces sp. NA07423]WHX15758.1 transposase family protein [Streptomyces sp. NA07423]